MSHVLIIDDDPFVQASIEAALADDAYSFACASTAAAGMAAALAQAPDLLLLDIELPDRDGYAVCRELRGHDSLAETMVIFVSGHGGGAERLAAYDAGGDDFVVKPFATEELRRKVALAMKHRSERAALRDQAGAAMQMAMTVMSDAGAMGVILAFFRASFRVRDLDGLAAAVLSATTEYGLDAVVRLTVGSQVCVLNSQGRSSAMEGVLLAGLADAGERIVTMERKLMVAYPHAALLIKNLPIEDDARCGRLRDHLAILVEGAEERIASLANEMLVREIIDRARTGVDAIDAGNRRQQSRTLAIMDAMQQDMERLLPHLGLTMAQENQLLDLTQRVLKETNAVYDEGLVFDDAFAGLRHLLNEGSSR